MKLSRTVSYAVRATIQLAKSESSIPIPCSKLASEGDMPERFLLQILRMLVTHGVLKSTRGVDGGYSLTKPPDQVSLLDVIEAIEGPMESDAQAQWTEESVQENLQSALKEVTQTARRQLGAIKLSQLLEPPQIPSKTATESTEIGVDAPR
jgi:Rrf2 family protein